MASEQNKKVIELIKSRPMNPKASIEQRRAGMEKISERVASDVVCTPTEAGGIGAEWVVAPGAALDRAILYLHGGGYVTGSIVTHRATAARISRASGARVLVIDYRLAPEHPFPAALEDAVAAYRWLAGRFDPRRIAFMGDSAGGGLALATLYKLRDEGFALPAAAVAVSPWTDLALTGPSLRANAAADPMLNVANLPTLANDYLAGADPRHHYASPLYGDASGLPPILIHVGSDEILRDDSIRMAEKLKAAGCDVEIEVWPRMPHAWHLFARIIPEGRHALARIGTFLQRRL